MIFNGRIVFESFLDRLVSFDKPLQTQQTDRERVMDVADGGLRLGCGTKSAKNRR